ncbi:MAG TPA: MmgE/PrpD family protein [Bryobacteraceae bacterium]|nr:MmgE/PrpD family protein [Bryobacteraceae bacterium]
MNPAISKDRRPEYTRELTGFLHGVTAENLPAEVLDRARYFLLDYLSVAIRGSQEESARAVQRMIQRTGAPGCATVIGTAIRTLPALAALANGTASHSIEQDDTHSGGSIHLGTTMYSVALALAETMPELAAAPFLAAVVAGYEAAARIAMAVQPKEHYALGFHPTQTCGVFGAAVTAAKLLGLSAEQMLAAVGIAGSMAAGNMEFLAEGAWTKRIHPGLAAQNGIQATMLAAEGFTGPCRILEGRDGFLRGYSRDPVPERLTEGLGESFEILQTAVKPHACCRYMQGPVDAILEMKRRHKIEPGQVREIEVAVLEAGWGIVCEPRNRKYHPESVVDAQFSMPFGAAVAVLHGAAGLDQFTLEQIHSPAVRRLMGKVTLVKDGRLEETFPREWPARASIRLEGGPDYEQFVRYPKGDPENPLSWEEMVAKFQTLAGTVLPAGRLDQVVEEMATAKPAALAALCAINPVSG